MATLEPWPSALGAQCLSQRTIWEVPKSQGLNSGSLDSKAYTVPRDGEQGRDTGCSAQSRETCCHTGSSLLIPMTLQCSFPIGIKDYSNWPTIPQVYLNGEFVGGCDILLQMHQNGDLVEELKKLGIRSALLDETKDQDSKWGKVAPGEEPLVSESHRQRSLTHSGSRCSDDRLRWFLQFVSSQVILACLLFGQGRSCREHNRNHCTVIINVALRDCCKQNSFLWCSLLFAWFRSKPGSFWIIVILHGSSTNMSVSLQR